MKKVVVNTVGIILAALLVWWMFRGTNWAEVAHAFRTVHWLWLGMSVIWVVLGFFTRVQRWSYIVSTAKPVSFRSMFSATQIGFLGNFVLPLRAGEAIRALVLSRLSQLSFSRCIAFVALDRVTDLVGLIVVMFLAVLTFHPAGPISMPTGFSVPDWAQGLLRPEAIRATALTMAGGLTGLVIMLVLLYVNQRIVLKLSDKILGIISHALAKHVHGLLENFASGFHIFRSLRDMSKALFFSLLTWITFAVSYMDVFHAFDLSLPWYAPFLTLSLLAIAISLPGAPGFIGQFHLAIMAAIFLLSPDVDVDRARAVAIMAHLINLIPIVIVGLYCLYREQLGLLALRKESLAAEAELESEESTEE